ncbi:MAG: metallophosphoesterase [Chloroflexota bacterium]|nr:metallophosphoesterase [Chloroflexota bacterium]
MSVAVAVACAPPGRAAIVAPSSPPSPPPTDPTATLVGAGDIAACNTDNDEATAKLIDHIKGEVFTLGDNAYEDGSPTDFTRCYVPTWGRHRSRTHPAVGNHDYGTAGAAGYFAYFGAAAGARGQGWYGYDAGTWHVVVLNSNCSIVDCAAGSPQERWLREDLARSQARCTLAYWHHPLFSSGLHGGEPALRPMWQALVDGRADVVLSGHDHDYERFAPQDADGRGSPEGVREFVVGTGGRSLYPVSARAPNSEAVLADVYGVLQLTLAPNAYAWSFIATDERVLDQGQGACH